MSQLQTKFKTLHKELAKRLVSRSEAIEVALLAMLSEEHALFLGPPGTSKSMLIELIVQAASGDVQKFQHLLTKFTSDAEIMGPVDIKIFKDSGRHVRRKTGSMLEAHILVLEELFKGSSSILNCLLTAINERVYMEEGNRTPLPLMTVFGASNETPEDKSLAALDDRFILRTEVRPLETDTEFRALADLSSHPMPRVISLDDWRQAIGEVRAVKILPEAIDAWIAVKNAAAAEGIGASARRWKKALRVMQAAAWMDGLSEVKSFYVDVLRHILWKAPDERRLAEKVVCKISSPITSTAVDIEDAARTVWEAAPKGADALLVEKIAGPHRQLKEMQDRLKREIELAGASQKLTRAEEALGRISLWCSELAKLAFAATMGPGAGSIA